VGSFAGAEQWVSLDILSSHYCGNSSVALSLLSVRIHPNTMTPNRTTAEVISNLVEAHPNIFKTHAPQFSAALPPGWGVLVERLCSLFERICSEEQLQGIEICSITSDTGALEFDIACDCDLSEVQIEALKAKIFSLRSISVFTCITCGVLVNDWPEDGVPVLCKKHSKDRRKGVIEKRKNA
jgi:hypothetical protein